MSSTAVDDQFAPRVYDYKRRWAVYVDYDHSTMTWKIGKVERWNMFRHFRDISIMQIDNAPDELGAYAQALEKLESYK